MDDPETTGVHLVRTRERVDEVSALAAALEVGSAWPACSTT